MKNHKQDEIRYILDGFEITSEYINECRVRYRIPDEVSNSQLYIDVFKGLFGFLKELNDDMRNIFVPSLTSLAKASNKYLIFSQKQFIKFSLNVANLYLRRSIDDDLTIETFEAEFNDELYAYYYNSLADILPFTTYDVKARPDQKAILKTLSHNYHSVINNRKLLAKIDGGRNNPLLESHRDDILFLTANLKSQEPNNSQFIISTIDIARLQPIFDDILWEPNIDFADFLQFAYISL